MNRFLKSILALGALFALAVSAQTTSSSTLAAGLNNISATPGNILSLQLTDTSGAVNQFIVYDTASTSTTNRVRPSYTSYTWYNTNVVTTFTNGIGVTENQTNTVRACVASTVAATTNEVTRLYTITVPANGTVIFDPTYPVLYSYGLGVKATGAASYNAVYTVVP